MFAYLYSFLSKKTIRFSYCLFRLNIYEVNVLRKLDIDSN